jgi:hypothetical protein
MGKAAVFRSGSKSQLMSDSYVADLFKMLTYFNVCCAFSSAGALLSNMI